MGIGPLAAGAVLLVVVAIATLTGCARAPVIDEAHAVLLAGWIEDTVRGRSRDPGELAVEDAGSGLSAAAAWLCGGARPPDVLRSRQARWNDLAAALAEGSVVTVPGLGLVAPRPGLARPLRLRAESLADGENLDRRSIDRILAGLCRDRDPVLRAAAAARDRADAAAGGRAWEGGRR